ncbi:MAG: FAD:protein FMN transferase [Saprospiraceae bacterium]
MIGLSVFLSACGEKKGSYTNLNGTAQGTTFNISYQDPANRDYSKPVDSLFRLIDKSMSLWDSSSVISRIARGEDVLLDEHFTAVFQRSQEISKETNGAFDVTVGPLVKAWGFSYKKGLPPPDSSMVDSLLQLIGYQKVGIKDGHLVKSDPRVSIDFNAIAQGYTVDLMASFLEHKGVKNYLVEIGGELRTSGVNDKGLPWVIGIDKPVDDPEAGRPLQASLTLSNKSLATSGSYRKFIIKDGRKFSHAINPANGWPIEHNLLSVSVIADDCTRADALATAFLVMGQQRSMELAQTLDVELYCISADEQGELQVQTTPGFEALINK